VKSRDDGPLLTNPMKTLTEKAAKALGYKVLSGPYGAGELWMLKNVVKDMAGRDHCLVQMPDGVEVWHNPSRQITRNKNGELEYMKP